MGIFCQINLFKPPDGTFQPGELVSGMIKYALDEQTEFEKITVSLKGMGHLSIRERQNKKDTTYMSSEVYVDTDEIIQEGNIEIPVGSYEIKFNFRLPQNIPPSFKFHKLIPGCTVDCRIKYYVRIKFEKPGWLNFNKRFRKDIDVTSPITPKLLMEPVICGERKELTRFFPSKKRTVMIKANIKNPILPIGGKIEVQYELENDTDVIIKSVETKLMEVLTFNATKTVKIFEEIPGTDSKTSSINCGETQTMEIEINVPGDRVSLTHSKIVSRDFEVLITAELPMPHRNLLLRIPVQVGDLVQRDESDAPPSYWEAMGEEDKEADSDDDAHKKKREKS